MLKPHSYKCRDGEDDGQHLICHRPSTHREPYSETDQGIAEYPKRDGLRESQCGLVVPNSQCRGSHCAVSQLMHTSQVHEPYGPQRTKRIPEICQSPVPEQLDSRDPA